MITTEEENLQNNTVVKDVALQQQHYATTENDDHEAFTNMQQPHEELQQNTAENYNEISSESNVIAMGPESYDESDENTSAGRIPIDTSNIDDKMEQNNPAADEHFNNVSNQITNTNDIQNPNDVIDEIQSTENNESSLNQNAADENAINKIADDENKSCAIESEINEAETLNTIATVPDSITVAAADSSGIKTENAEEENTILLPGPDKQLDAVVEDVVIDEQTIAFKGEGDADTSQGDVLAEPLGEEENEYAGKINVKPIGNKIIKVVSENDEEEDIGRRRTTRKSAVAAAAAIRVRSEPSPDLDDERTIGSRSRVKRAAARNPVGMYNENLAYSDKKKNRPITSTPVSKNVKGKEETKSPITIDKRQCRVCLSKSTLVSLFRIDDTCSIADKLMSICNSVQIGHKDDLPQYVCSNCSQTVNIAYNLKMLCEKTDRDLRNKLRKGNKYKSTTNTNNKISTTAVAAVTTASIIIEPNDVLDVEHDKSNNDHEFVPVNESGNSGGDESDENDVDYGTKRKRKKTSLKKRSKNRNDSEKNGEIQQIDDDGNDVTARSTDDEVSPPKKKRSKVKKAKSNDGDTTATNQDDSKQPPKEHICAYCEQKFPSKNSLREHRKTHANEKPLVCEQCNKQFKLLGSYKTHLQKHKEEEASLTCAECQTQFPNKVEHRKHMQEVHGETPVTFTCDQCKRVFTTQARLDKHKKDNKCPGPYAQASVKKEKKRNSEVEAMVMGRDLFKCVAPLTTTYWSDSFSD